jgi:outer membrane protein assembly complex protein YaeT
MWLRFAARAVAMWALAAVIQPGVARADVVEYLGRRVTTVSLALEGRPLADARVMTLLQSRVGAVLAAADVRQSIAHLYSTGRFEDIRVRAVADGDGVALTYELTPLRPITAIRFEGGAPGIRENKLRGRVVERFGPSPRPARMREIAAYVTSDLQELGYLRARVSPRTDIAFGSSHAALVLVLAPGDRTHIGRIDVQGETGVPAATLLRELRVSTGDPFQSPKLAARIEHYLSGRRRRGFLAARLDVGTEFTDGDRVVNLKLTSHPGPHVALRFEGDALPADRRDDLVPIARESSADEDLLEDSVNRIREYLRGRGYRDGSVQYAREERDGELIITFTIRRGPQYRVGRIEFAGNASIPLTDLQPHLLVRAGQPFSASAIDADLAKVTDIYRRQGFSAVQTDVTFESQPDVAAAAEVPVAIRIAITENVRTLVSSVHVEGVHAVAETELTGSLGLQPGAPFFVTQMAIDRDVIQSRLANLGYQSATVTTNPRLSADGSRADVLFTVREGPQLFVEHVLIAGNERTKTSTIARELQVKPGDALGLDRVNESQRRLAALGLFRRARITEMGHGDETRRDVLVTVEEAPAATIGFGGGLEVGQFLRTDSSGVPSERLEVAPRGFFEVGRRNLFGKNRSINLFTRVSLGNLSRPQGDPGADFVEYRVLGTFREPRVLRTTADAFLTATVEQQSRTSFNFARRALNGEVVRRLSRAVSVTGSYQIQRTELFDETIDPALTTSVTTVDRVFPQVRLSSFATSVVRDTRDDLTEPSAGEFLSANTQLAGRRIGSEVGFARSFLTAQTFHLLPRARRTVFAASARLGLAAAFPRLTADRDANGNPVVDAQGQPVFVTVRDLPASERFFAGGDTTVRGFALDRLGTPELFDRNGFPTGGGGLVVLNAEARIPLRGGLGAVGFVDAGNVFAQPSKIALSGIRGSVGVGVRYKSPIGPVRVDLGFKLNRTVIASEREPLTALHISLGQAF